jgi:hypothetical protein
MRRQSSGSRNAVRRDFSNATNRDQSRRDDASREGVTAGTRRFAKRRSGAHSQSSPTVDGATLATIVGTPSEQAGPVYKITIGRPDVDPQGVRAAVDLLGKTSTTRQ